MSQQAQAETEVISGVIAGIIQKGADKWQVAVKEQPDSQYTKNLWTKDQALVSHLSTMIGQPLSFMCGVSHWTNQQNQPIRSLWINGVGETGYAAQTAAPAQQPVHVQPQPVQMGRSIMQPGGFPQQQPGGFPQQQAPVQQQPMQAAPATQVGSPEREARIHRQAATKVAAILIGYIPEEQRTLDTLLTISDRLVTYYERGSGVTPPAAPVQGGYENPGEFQGTGDDDIPF